MTYQRHLNVRDIPLSPPISCPLSFFFYHPEVGLTTFFWVNNRSQNAVSGSVAQVLSRASPRPRIHDHRHRAYPFCPWGVRVPDFLTGTVFISLTGTHRSGHASHDFDSSGDPGPHHL